VTIARRPLEVLLVEDNPADVRLTLEALRDLSPDTLVTVAHDGIEALALLTDRRKQQRVLPDLVLLDLNLPRMPGREVLEKIKGTLALRHIPVVVLTTSQADQDVLDCYSRSANAVINKPVDFDRFVATMSAFAAFWLDEARIWRT
jgi:two-component system, chemotaxis family, response regulator Rcp1